MPIIDLQRRMRQLGEIRIGRVVDTGKVSQKTGKPILRPEKLNIFRLTSASRPLLEEVAELYGGQVQAWTPANGGPAEWEVYTEANRIPVLIPPRDPVTQWYELYKGSKCVRRCDGVTEQKNDRACMCDPEKRDCQITTRLNVMLRDIPGLGVWLLTSHGYYAAVELPEVAQFLASTNGYVDAWLSMEEKQVPLDDGKTARFMVPKLDVAVTPAQLLAGAGGVSQPAVAEVRRAEVESGTGQAAIEAPAPSPAPAQPELTAEVLLAAARKATTLQQWQEIWRTGADAGVTLGDRKAELVAIGERLAAADKTTAPEQPALAASQSEPPDVDVLWQQIVALSPWPMSELESQFARAMGGVPHNHATENELQMFLKRLKAGDFTKAAPATADDGEVPF